MDASIAGCLANINKSYKVFTFKGKKMSKPQVEAVLRYGLKQGYTCTSELTDVEIETVINVGVL